MTSRNFALIRGGRYGEPLPARVRLGPRGEDLPAPPEKEPRSLRDLLGPMPEERARMARSPDSPFARFDHDKVGA